MRGQIMGALDVQHFEYKVTPAPARGQKGAGIKGAEARFAHGLETVINAHAAEGWDYLRAEILPSEERQGLTSSHIVYRSVLVFRRPVVEASQSLGAQDEEPVLAPPVSDGAEPGQSSGDAVT
ncbi:MAG: DUF4177 domain-containing protein, partial [Pseudomonadota bacterium]